MVRRSKLIASFNKLCMACVFIMLTIILMIAIFGAPE